MPDATEPIGWVVGAQLIDSQPDSRGQFVPGYQVQFTLSNGHTDQVFVPATEYTVDNVRAAIAAKAAQIVAVSRLTGTVEGG